MMLQNLQFSPEIMDGLLQPASMQGVTSSLVAYETLQLFNRLLYEHRGKDICPHDF